MKKHPDVDKEFNKLLSGMSKFQAIRLVRKMTKLFNRFCEQCKRMAMENPKRSMNDYCKECQGDIQETLERFTK